MTEPSYETLFCPYKVKTPDETQGIQGAQVASKYVNNALRHLTAETKATISSRSELKSSSSERALMIR